MASSTSHCWIGTSRLRQALSQPPGLSFRLQKCEHISLSDWALHVPDDGAVAVVHELNTDLCTLSLGTSSPEHLGDSGELDRLHAAGVHVVRVTKVLGRILSTRNLLYDGLDWPCPAAACLQIKKEHEEERIMVCTDGMEENLVGLLKAHYSDVFSTEWRCLWDNFNVEELPRRLQNSEGQVMKLQALIPEAGETLFLEGPPESRKMTIAQILVSSWTEGRTDLLDLSTLQLLVYVNCSAVEGHLIQEIMTQCSLINKSTENELRTVLTRASGEALLLLDGYREENKTFDESLKRFLSERRGCRVLVMASPANCHSLKEACGTGEMLRLEAQTV